MTIPAEWILGGTTQRFDLDDRLSVWALDADGRVSGPVLDRRRVVDLH